MDSLQIRTGEISLKILDDAGNERGIFKFNPDDIQSAKRVMSLQEELALKQTDFEIRSQACETPEEKVDMLEEVVTYFRGVIDQCFGEGSSQVLFGDAKSISMFDDFLTGIMPYYEAASKKRMAKSGKKS